VAVLNAGWSASLALDLAFGKSPKLEYDDFSRLNAIREDAARL